MSDNTSIMNFKEAVAHFDITPRTLRYYEYLELIKPIRDGRKRFYTKREIARIHLILRGRRFGFKLEDIRQWLELYDPQSGNRAQTETWLGHATAQLDELGRRRDEISEAIAELSSLIDEAKRLLARSGGK